MIGGKKGNREEELKRDTNSGSELHTIITRQEGRNGSVLYYKNRRNYILSQLAW